MTVGQVSAEGRDEEEFPHDEDEGDGPHAQQIFQCRFVAHHHVACDGVEQHFEAGAGAVLGQHLDELDADDDVQRAL